MIATATFPGSPRRLSQGEYVAMTANAASATTTCAPLTSPASAIPSSASMNTPPPAVGRESRPAASGRSPPGRFTRSATTSVRSLRALPAAPNAMPDRAAKTSSLGNASVPRAIQPPAQTPAAAMRRLPARARRSRSRTEEFPVERLVLRHDLVGREIAGARHSRRAHPLLALGVLQDAERCIHHRVHRAGLRQHAGLAVHHDLGDAARPRGDDGHAAPHRLAALQTARPPP